MLIVRFRHPFFGIVQMEAAVFQYPFASHLDTGDEPTLRLATFTAEPTESAFFFQGKLVEPRRAASLLRGLMTIVQSRFHTPRTMLAAMGIAGADPIVTSHDDRLRFEGFSACCGAYARVDLLAGAVDAETIGRGTTNVDFNQPMLNALATIKAKDDVTLSVGCDEVAIKNQGKSVVEKKVALPNRWLKGLIEVQAVQARMKLVFELDALQANRFLRTLPRMKTHRRQTWVVKSGNSLRLSQVKANNAVVVGGLERLRVLESLVPDAKSLSVYADEQTGASAWVLAFSHCRFHLVISPEVWRGFSGEGQVLTSLATKHEKAIPSVRAQLKWQSIIEKAELAKSTKLAAEVIDGALASLATRGLVGFDLVESCYFHRELPFDLSQVEKLQPRLLAARKLIDAGHVRRASEQKNTTEWFIQSGNVEHRVHFETTNANWKCTCPWYAKHGVSRGPCKHILAAQINLEETC